MPYIAVANPFSWLVKLFTTDCEGATFCRWIAIETLDVLLKLFLGPNMRDTNPLVTLSGRASRLDYQQNSFLRFQFVGILLKTPHDGSAHISTLAHSSFPDSLLKHFGARLILFMGKGVYVMVLLCRIKLLPVIMFCLS